MTAFRLLSIALLGVLACDSASPTPMPDRCNIRLVDITPATPVLLVGDTITLTATAIGPASCLPTGTGTSRPFLWFTPDTTLLTVNRTSGLVRGRGQGSGSVGVGVQTGHGFVTLGALSVAVNGTVP